MDRRKFIVGAGAVTALCGAGLALSPSRAQAGWISGYAKQGGGYGLGRFDHNLKFEPLIESAERLHYVYAHPTRVEICAPARRPGTALLVWRESLPALEVTAPKGHHFYGHGVFNLDGSLFFATENEFETGRGVIGIYDPAQNYARIGQFDSGGVGPHDIRLHPDGAHLFVANGGLRTHPASGRTVLNLDEMQPNLTLLNIASGDIAQQASLKPKWSSLSLRHIHPTATGGLLVGAQDQWNDDPGRPLVGHWMPGRQIKMFQAPANGWQVFNSYIGSVAVDQSGKIAAAASPRGGLVGMWNLSTGNFIADFTKTDICGLAPAQAAGQFMATAGDGWAGLLTAKAQVLCHSESTVRFDNHCRLT